jgi:hypothetical protein
MRVAMLPLLLLALVHSAAAQRGGTFERTVQPFLASNCYGRHHQNVSSVPAGSPNGEVSLSGRDGGANRGVCTAGFQAGDRALSTAGTPMTNLYMTMLTSAGVKAESIGDSSGKVQQLTEV